MKILITGANGQLGSEMRLLARHSNHEFIFTDVNQVEGQETVFLDITDRQAIMQMVQSQGIQAIVNCAAWTNVDACETDPALATLAHKLNALAPENLALAMKAVDGLLIHISTDYVFGTEAYNTPCREDQQGTPTGVYGQTKKDGEERILATECKHVIIRTSWLYSEFGKNFCRTMLQLTAERPTLNVVYDQCGTPTYALDLARAICTILQDYQLTQTENGFDLGFATVKSELVKKRLEGCSEIVLFAATVGIETDRLISRYSSVSPARAHMIQSIGAERIEALCDTFENILKADGIDLCPRFSAGYGDLPLELQRDIFKALDCPKNIGLTLNESLLMSPTKSVTAIIGIKRG